MPRFVVLTHDHPHWHWDLMLEANGALRTWRLDADPQSAQPIPATVLPNHRLQYLEYEGPVSNNRGHVQRWDAGEYSIEEDGAQALRLVLQGQRLQGRAVLRADAAGQLWFELQTQAEEQLASDG